MARPIPYGLLLLLLLNAPAAMAGVEDAVFRDGFDRAADGEPPDLAGAEVGSYPTGALAPESRVSVSDGKGVLRLTGKARNYGDLAQVALAGETLIYDFDLYLARSGTSVAHCGFIGDTAFDSLDQNPMALWVQAKASGAVEYRGNGAWRPSGLTHPPDTWQHYRLSYRVGDPTFQLRIGAAGAPVSLGINAATPPTRIQRLLIAAGGTDGTEAALDNTELVLRTASRAVAPTVPRYQPAAEILSEVVIARQHGRYIGWPTIDRAANGDLLIVFSGDRDWHVDPYGKVFLVRSTDDGKTWGDPELVIDTPLDDRDTGLVTLQDGTVIVTFSAANWSKTKPYSQDYKRFYDSLNPAAITAWSAYWMVASQDHGYTWGPPVKIPGLVPHGPVELTDGQLLLVKSAIFSSFDVGATWPQIASIPKPIGWASDYSWPSEVHGAETATGEVVALIRYRAGSDIRLRQMTSADRGLTWSTPIATPMRGYPAHVLRLDNDWLLATYGLRVSPQSQRATLSMDHGKTWLTDREIVLSNAIPQNGGHMGYPASVQLPDGTIWTVYYQIEQAGHGEHPSLMGTHWRLRDQRDWTMLHMVTPLISSGAWRP